MKQTLALSTLLATLALSACGKKAEQAPQTKTAEGAPPAASAAAGPAASAPANSEADERAAAERAKKQALMDYATMEDQYLNDAHAQWASSAKASSTFGDDRGEPSQSNKPDNIVGTVDSRSWTNNHQDVGMDWLQANFSKPVAATEVRVVFTSGDGVEAVSKLELQDTQGGWHTVWAGLSDVKVDSRGNRTWFAKQFQKTAYQANAVKITIANNVQSGYKVVDAVQLVGE